MQVGLTGDYIAYMYEQSSVYKIGVSPVID